MIATTSNHITYTSYQLNFTGVVHNILVLLTGSQLSADTVLTFLSSIWFYFSILAFMASALLIYGIIYSYIKIGEYDEVIAESITEEEQLWQDVHGVTQTDRRWHEVKQHVASSNPNDWKLAIIEADIMLGEVLTAAGYAGLSIGDQLKSASPTQFSTLQDAWDAHHIRNRIAHEGADFVLTQNAAREAIVKYERVFNEFKQVHGH